MHSVPNHRGSSGYYIRSVVWAPGGRSSRVLRFTIASGKIVNADIIVDPARLRELQVTALNG
ncbi:MAG: hypothetical protein ABSB35_29870 [Bryobacteraceae bacterium]